jgi:alpha-tubulin suppressor-like RCC1 family protein
MRLVSLAVACCVLSNAVPARAEAPTVKQVAASLHVLLLLSDGSVVALGENRSGQLGRPKSIGVKPPGKVVLPAKAVQVAAGQDSSFAVLEDGSVWAWGRGYERQLGAALAGETERATPAAVRGLRGVTSVATNGKSVLAVMGDGTVKAWGDLPKVLTGGRTEFPGFAAPLVVRGLTGVTRVAWTGGFGLALTTGGRVLAFGGNKDGYLGLGTTGEAQPPTEIPSLVDVVSIAVTGDAGAAVTKDGRVWTWGHNRQAGLGDGEHADVGDPGQPTPRPVKGITGAVEVACGDYGRHVIVRTASGGLVGWGNSDWGQLGAGISGDFQPKPTAIKLPGVEQHWVGGNFSFARTKDGAFWFWGERDGARALLGTKANQKVPAKVPLETLLAGLQ